MILFSGIFLLFSIIEIILVTISWWGSIEIFSGLGFGGFRNFIFRIPVFFVFKFSIADKFFFPVVFRIFSCSFDDWILEF